jgi:hypothetical protein
MGNWYLVTKRINGHFYLYWQKTYRLNGKVKTLNQYVGPVAAKTPPMGSLKEQMANASPEHKQLRADYDAGKISKLQYLEAIASKSEPTVPSNFQSLTWDEKIAALKPLGRYPVPQNNLATGETIILRSTNLPNGYVVGKIKEATLPDGTTYRYVAFERIEDQ